MDSAGSETFRTTPRTRATLRVRLGGGETGDVPQDAWATTRDLGPGGAYLRAEKPYEPGTRLILKIEAPGDEPPLTLEAEVKWCTPAGAKEPGMGVSFVSPSAEIRQRLSDLLQAGELPILELYGDD